MNKDTTLRFSDLKLSKEVATAVDSIGYEIPSPIQAQAIPLLLQGRDILGVAQTGTGKTAAFALPLLSRINIKQKQPQILCLTPTRELAIQVSEAFQTYAQNIKGFKVLPVYGGTDYRGQIRQLERGVHVVVGTPGRVMDHMRKKTLRLEGISALVLDEADEMLRMGFIDDVEWILEHVPDKHQSALFSATMPAPIRKLTSNYLNNPVEITIKQQSTAAAGIRQRYVQLKNNEKLDTLTRIMEVEEFEAAIVFVRTKNATLEVSDRLQARGYAVAALNGDIAQKQREKIVDNLKKSKLDIIVATDVAARGLDVERISHVFNYDVPYDTESYVHRIGRTGRAGRTGDAILFVNGRERRMLNAIEKATHKKIAAFEFPSAETLNERKLEKLFTRINLELEKDLSEYRSVINRFLERYPIDPVELAVALASIEGDSKPFYVKQLPASKTKGKGQSLSDEKINMVTYRLAVGKEHKVEKKDIVGAIANEAGLESRYMGKIHIHGKHSFIELPEGMPPDIFRNLKDVSIKGHRLNISEADGKGSPASDKGGRSTKRKNSSKKPVKSKERKSGKNSGKKKSKNKKSSGITKNARTQTSKGKKKSGKTRAKRSGA